MKFIGSILRIIGGTIILAASIVWATSDLSKPLWLIIGTIIGILIMYSSRITTWISNLWARHRRIILNKREQAKAAKEEATRAQAKAAQEEAEKQAALEQAAVFDDLVLSIATPKKIEKALRYLIKNRPDLPEQLNDVLNQFDKARKNLKKIEEFEKSNEMFSSDVPGFEAALSDIATHSGLIINAVRLNTNIENKIEEAIEKNQITLDKAERALSAILHYANTKHIENRPDQSTALLEVTATVYTDLANQTKEVPKW